jgi:Flp pilus assembly protein TadB
VIAFAAMAGTLAALGILVVAREVRPAPPRLDLALARIQSTRLQPDEPEAGQGLGERIGGWLTDHLARPAGMLAIPRTDLALLDRSIERFMLDKLALFVAGITIPTVVAGLLALAGAALPWTVPVLASLLLAAGLSFVPDVNVRSAARQRRKDFRYAFAAYLQLVVLEREAGAALNTALEGPVSIAETWPFRRIAAALERARRGQYQPWLALAELGERIGVHDLIDLAHTAQIAGTEGAKIHDVLTAKVTAMRHEASASTRAEANSRTTAMWVPTSLLMLGFVVLVGYPFFSRLLAAG